MTASAAYSALDWQGFLAARHGGGLYWALFATLAAFLGAVYNAWVLLVVILRQHPGFPA